MLMRMINFANKQFHYLIKTPHQRFGKISLQLTTITATTMHAAVCCAIEKLRIRVRLCGAQNEEVAGS